jgi:endonuclease/exonuclease/phosphatase family metal-dependent hydrolase
MKRADDPTASRRKNIFSVASYNVHQCVGVDRRRDPERVARVIKGLDADIIGLQEVDSRGGSGESRFQMKYLAEACDLNAVAGPTIRTHSGEYGNVLLTRRKIYSVRRLDLSVPGRESRGAIDATIDLDGEAVRVIVAHLGLRLTERRYQVQQLLTALSDRRTRLVVLVCDLNEWFPLGGCLRCLDQRMGRSPALRSFPSFFPFLALDRIWVCPREALVTVSAVRSSLTRIASDHLPVKATVALD